MLKKCLKYDLAAVFRLLWILLVAIGVIVIAGGVGLRFATELAFLPDYATDATTDPQVLLVMIRTLLGMGGYFFFMLCIFALGAILTLGSILVYWRLYSHFFTDQGYLTFTLPVKRSTLYLSKVLTCTIAESSLLAAAVGGFMIILPFIIPTEGFALIDFTYLFKELPVVMAEAWDFWGVGSIIWPIVWLALTPLAFLATQLASSGLVFLCITLGSTIFKKGKLLASIGIYLLVNGLTSGLIEFLSFPLFISLTAANAHVMGFTTTLVILIAVAMAACAAALLHFINLTLLERKLNLA